MRNDGAGIGKGVDALDCAGDPDLMPNELPQASLKTAMPNQEWRRNYVIARGSNRKANSVVIGQHIGERTEAADPIEHRSAHRDGCATTRFREAEADRSNRLRQKLQIDGKGRQPRPQCFAANAIIEASHQTNPWRFKKRSERPQIARPDDDVAIGKNERVVPGLWHHIDQIRNLAIDAMTSWLDHKFYAVIRQTRLHCSHHGSSGRFVTVCAA